MGIEIKRGRGRPKKENAKYNRITIRMTEDEFERLSEYCEINDRKPGELIRSFIRTIVRRNED